MKKHMTQEVAIKSAWMILEGLGFSREINVDLEKTVTAVYESAPAADVVERRTGTWLHEQLLPDNVYGHMVAECSECHEVRIVDNFCPNCGARMDGDL